MNFLCVFMNVYLCIPYVCMLILPWLTIYNIQDGGDKISKITENFRKSFQKHTYLEVTK